MTPTLLIADDEKTVHDILRKLLRSSEYRIVSVFDGGEVAGAVRREKPDLILLDIQMPNKTGREILLELRNDINTRMIPVLILTGQRGIQPVGEVEGLELGADDYISKPFDLDVLKARIASILHRNERYLASHPLSHLPGSSAIEHEMRRRIREGDRFALIYVDIDRFRDYNEAEGNDQGDQVLRDLADILRESLQAVGPERGFVGHIAEDDFIVLTDPGSEEKLAHHIREAFDRRFSSLALSIGSTSTELHDFKHYAKLMDIVKKFKNFLRDRQNHTESVYIKDPGRPQKR